MKVEQRQIMGEKVTMRALHLAQQKGGS